MNRTPSTPDRNLIPLENIRIASPCRADWNLMEGDERVRHCQSCAKNVYNLSAMSKAEAEKLIQEKEGKLCVRFYQRADGTIISDNCPVGLKIVRRPFMFLLAGFAALLASGGMIFSHQTQAATDVQTQTSTPITLEKCRKVPVLGSIINFFRPQTYTFMGAASNQMTS